MVDNYLTDELAVGVLLSCIDRFSTEPKKALVIVVAQAIPHSHWLSHQVSLKRPEVTIGEGRTISCGNLQIKFIYETTNINTLHALQPVCWIPLSDRIPARMIMVLAYRARIGENIYVSGGS